MSTLKKRTLVIDAFNNFKEKLCEKNLNITNIVSVCKDGAASLTKKCKIFRLSQKRTQSNYSYFLSLHFRPAKSASLDDILKKVVGIVNFIRANAMRYP